MESFDNDATKKLLGFDYQKLIALKLALNSSPNDVIFIECKGDVAKDTTTTEIKLHASKNHLGTNHEDFWKTLKNWVVERNKLTTYNRLILHTTSHINKDTFFYGWNKKSDADRLNAVKTVFPKHPDTIKPFISIISNFNHEYSQDDLRGILKRVEILDSQKSISDTIEEIKNCSAFTLIPSQFRDNVVNYLYGLVSLVPARDGDKDWEVDINEFQRDFQHIARRYLQGEIPFPLVQKVEVKSSKNVDEYIFVEELKKINYSNKVSRAVSDYLRSNLSVERLLVNNPLVQPDLDNFDEEILDEILDLKDSASCQVTNVMISNGQCIQISQKLYDECIMKMPLRKIPNVQPIQNYFQRGRIHQAVENDVFKWCFHLEEISEGS